MELGPVDAGLESVGERDFEDLRLEDDLAPQADLRPVEEGLHRAELGRHGAHHHQTRLRNRHDGAPVGVPDHLFEARGDVSPKVDTCRRGDPAADLGFSPAALGHSHGAGAHRGLRRTFTADVEVVQLEEPRL